MNTDAEHMFVVVEGEGDKGAVNALLPNLAAHLELAPIPWHVAEITVLTPNKGKEFCKRAPSQVTTVANAARRRRGCQGLLVLQDTDDSGASAPDPRAHATVLARMFAEHGLKFPVAVALMQPEYEVLFLPCLHLMAGRSIVVDPTPFAGPPEQKRDVKGVHLVPPRTRVPYAVTRDQAFLTTLLDFDVLAQSKLRSFELLCDALRFLFEAPPFAVFPPPDATAAKPAR